MKSSPDYPLGIFKPFLSY